MVCWLEVDALRRLLGDDAGTALAEKSSELGVYRWVYRTVLRDFDDLGVAYADGGLLPPADR